MKTPEQIGQRIMEYIIEARLVRGDCAIDLSHGVVQVWTGNAAEQLGGLVAEHTGEVTTIIADLRRKLALAGVEGSPPPGMETTIGSLSRRLVAAEQRAERLAAEVHGWRHANECIDTLGHMRGEYDDRPEDGHQLRCDIADRIDKAHAAVDAARDLPADGENKETT